MQVAFLFVAPAVACEPVDIGALLGGPEPRILVLGERHGSRTDLKRAAKVARRLAKQGPVTVALEAVAEAHQDVMDALTAREIRAWEVEAGAEWSSTWGHAFEPYRRLLQVRGPRFVAAGPPLGPKPDDAVVPVPASYNDLFRDNALAHGMTEDQVPDFSAAMAWREYRIAQLALQRWDGQGVLLVVVGRGHVTRNLGVPWQLTQGMTEVPWSSALLHPGHACDEADRYLP